MRAATTRPKARTVPGKASSFRSNKLTVRYAGMRWHLLQDRGKFLLIERRGCCQWIDRAVAT